MKRKPEPNLMMPLLLEAERRKTLVDAINAALDIERQYSRPFFLRVGYGAKLVRHELQKLLDEAPR